MKMFKPIKNGFTIMEMLVVMSTVAILSSILIAYSRISERQVILFKDQAKIISTILKAKTLALNTYAKSGAPCSYGVHFDRDSKEFRIFKDLDNSGSTADCATADKKYDPGSAYAQQENLDPPAVEKLDRNLSFAELGFTDIVFIPPNPDVIITPDPAPNNEAVITLATSDGGSKKIKINRFGQVSIE